MPTVGKMLSSHTLAANIINHHNTDDCVLDASELAMLQRFSVHPTISTRDAILRDQGMSVERNPELRGKKVMQSGSLVAFCVARHGTGIPAFEEREIEMLRVWFEGGMVGRI